MSSQLVPESSASPPEDDGRAERAPSQLAADEPSFARSVGLAGVMLAVLGSAVVLLNEISGPRFISRNMGLFAFILGVVGMLYHALRDANLEVRRTYGVLLGLGLIGVSAVVTVVNHDLFVSYGAGCLLGSLCFLLAFGRHEDDPFWRQIIVGVLAGLGAVQALIALGAAIIRPDFLAGPGLIMGVLGLLWLCGALAQFDAGSENRRYLALGLAAFAVAAIGYTLVRSLLPGLFGASDRPFFVPGGLILLVLGVQYGGVALGVLSDNQVVVMTRRELSAYFYSPIAYLVFLGMAAMLAINYLFFLYVVERGQVTREPIVRFLGLNIFSAIGTVFFVPAITMRLLSEEKRSGTYEVLMCAPVRETSVVLSKFLAGLTFFMLLWVPLGLYMIGFGVAGGKAFDYRPFLSFYLALLFCGAAFISMGLFFSSLTRNQIIAFVLTFVALLLQVLFFFVRDFQGINPLWQALFTRLGYLNLWQESLSGRLPVRDLILQASLCVFWLYLTVRVLEARRWS